MHRLKKILPWIFLILILLCSGCTTERVSYNETLEGELQVHYIDVGQGDATLITCGGESLLIDGGDNAAGKNVVAYIKDLGIHELTYMIGTHPGADHTGGLDDVLYHFPVGTILLTDKASKKDRGTATYQTLLAVIQSMGETYVEPEVGETYRLGSATFTILSPDRSYEDSNDTSIVVRLDHGDTGFLFTGDATATAEADMLAAGLNLRADVYKTGHHGSNSSSSWDFIKAVDPEAVVISCGSDNSYGHPGKDALYRLNNYGVDLYRTDEQGTIIAASDGKIITFSTAPTENWQSGGQSKVVSQSNRENTNSNSGSDVAYVLNTNTKTFHLPTCSSAAEMKPKNRQDVDWTREECMKRGFTPCRKCNP